MSLSLVTIPPDEWALVKEQANIALNSGFLPAAIKNANQALAIVIKGRELGVPMMQALSSITVIQGKPVANAELMAALIYRDHGDDALRIIKSDNEECIITYKRRNATGERLQYTFSIRDAQKAGLSNSPTWQKYPAAMLRARCISAVARMAFQDSIAGMYTPEELGAEVEVDAEGVVTIKDVTPQQEDDDFMTAPPLPLMEVERSHGNQSLNTRPSPQRRVPLTEIPLPDEEADGSIPDPIDQQRNPNANWDKFERWGRKLLAESLGCGDVLIDELMNNVRNNLTKHDELNKEPILSALVKTFKGFKTSGDASLFSQSFGRVE